MPLVLWGGGRKSSLPSWPASPKAQTSLDPTRWRVETKSHSEVTDFEIDRGETMLHFRRPLTLE